VTPEVQRLLNLIRLALDRFETTEDIKALDDAHASINDIFELIAPD